MTKQICLSVDAMGGDDAPSALVDGIALFARKNSDQVSKILLHGQQELLQPLLEQAPDAARICEVRHTDTYVSMTDKPSKAIRQARGSSMWNAIRCVKTGEADAAVSAGNTGALMVLGKVLLGMVKNVHRPAIAASWPAPEGYSVVLDVGANVVCSAPQLVEFAILGEAFSRVVHRKQSPSVGLLNVGTEDVKGNDVVREADRLLRAAKLELNYAGFVEGNDISLGRTDVVVTDGFTGNVALKAAEGTAKLAARVLKQSLMSSPVNKLGAFLSQDAFRQLKDKMDPRNGNGGLFLGLGGLVVKSHGSTDGIGFAQALDVARRMSQSDYLNTIQQNLTVFADRQKEQQS
ncbi:Phosphate:acyl-ACP acyltransferase PlsX (EC 2.3.1.n2) [hydrothermal vent metagenome]|uniref:phosphate acyltransferase n=1 Tax=hydrothermal vent metagenome TaxID=652676 RepID=A0A3B0RSI3_9ZZZZ